MKVGGQFCFISSNKFFRAAYGLKLRQLLKTCRLRTVIDFGELPVFAAGTDPAIIQFEKAGPEKHHQLTAVAVKERSEIQHLLKAVKTRGGALSQTALQDSGWSVESGRTNALLNKLRNAGKPLGEYIKKGFYRGITTGLNEAFIVDGMTRDKLIEEDSSSAEVLKPFVRGRDVKRWKVDFQNLWFIFTQRGIDINKYPAIKNHLSQYRQQLEPKPRNWPSNTPWPGRKIGSYKWYEIQDTTAYWKEFEQPKIIFSDIGTVLKAFYTEEDFYGANTVYVMPVKDLEVSLLAILLSKPIDWFARQTFQSLGDPWKGGRLRFINQNMVKIPIPPALDSAQTCLSELAKSAAQAEDNALAAIETEINEIVCRLFNLTPDEIEIVEGGD